MLDITLPVTDTHSDTVDDLADRCVRHLGDISHYITLSALQMRLLRRMGLAPHSAAGRLVIALTGFLVMLLPALTLAALAGQLAESPVLIWTGIAALFAAGMVIAPAMIATATVNCLAWIRNLVDPDELAAQLAGVRRRWSHRIFVPIGVAAAVPATFLTLSMHERAAGPLWVGALYIGFVLMFTLAQNAFAMGLVLYEAVSLAACTHRMYPLSPADSVTVRQSVRGYNQLGTFFVLIWTPLILALLLLLPGGSALALPFVVIHLGLEFIITGIGALAPRVVLGRVIREAKEREMQALQVRLAVLSPRVGKLGAEEYEELRRLRETHDYIRDSSENLLPLGALARIVGTLLLSTVTVLLTVLAQEWLQGVGARLFR